MSALVQYGQERRTRVDNMHLSNSWVVDHKAYIEWKYPGWKTKVGEKSGVEVVEGYVWVKLYCTLLQPHVQQYQWEVQPDQQLSNPPLPPQPWPQLPEPPPQCQVLQQHAQEIKVVCLKWILLWCTINFLLEMEMDSVLEIFPSLTVFPLWRTSLPSSPWTGSSAQRLRKVMIALVRGENGWCNIYPVKEMTDEIEWKTKIIYTNLC